jgi:cyanate permease
LRSPWVTYRPAWATQQKKKKKKKNLFKNHLAWKLIVYNYLWHYQIHWIFGTLVANVNDEDRKTFSELLPKQLDLLGLE